MFDDSFLGESTQFTANTGLCLSKVANTGLDGGGTLVSLVTAASNGTYVKSVTVKIETAVSQGMLRFFIYDGTNTRLLLEIKVDPSVKSTATFLGYSRLFPLNYMLKSGDILKVGTEVGNTFAVTAEAYDWTYP